MRIHARLVLDAKPNKPVTYIISAEAAWEDLQVSNTTTQLCGCAYEAHLPQILDALTNNLIHTRITIEQCLITINCVWADLFDCLAPEEQAQFDKLSTQHRFEETAKEWITEYIGHNRFKVDFHWTQDAWTVEFITKSGRPLPYLRTDIQNILSDIIQYDDSWRSIDV